MVTTAGRLREHDGGLRRRLILRAGSSGGPTRSHRRSSGWSSALSAHGGLPDREALRDRVGVPLGLTEPPSPREAVATGEQPSA